MTPTENRFLEALEFCGITEYIIYRWNTYCQARELLLVEESSEHPDAKVISLLQSDISHDIYCLNTIFEKCDPSEGETLESEMPKVLAWYRDMKGMQFPNGGLQNG